MATQATGANVADFIFRVSGFSAEELKVTGFSGREAISELFHFRVELISERADIELDEMLGKGAGLQIVGEVGRYVQGVIRRFERTGDAHDSTKYAAEIVPLQWYLTQRHDCRIFHEETCEDMTVPGIIEKVMRDAGIPEDTYDLTRLGPGYAVREYVVQYRESDMDFISRLAEDEGIFYFFEHTDAGCVMVFGDSPAAHSGVGGGDKGQQQQQQQRNHGGGGYDPAVIPYHDESGLLESREFVFDVRVENAIQVGSVTLDDFNFQKPDLDLQTKEQKAAKFTALSVYDYPGKFDDPDEGEKRLALFRLEASQARRRVTRMRATARHLAAGYYFRLDAKPDGDIDDAFLITEVLHRGVQTQSAEAEAVDQAGFGYEAVVSAIPKGTPFRPLRVTRRPTVLGSQTALVVRPKGNEREEIHVDKFGRVKVQFHWDHQQEDPEDTSMFVRVSQGWAGASWGMMFLPRVGQEVIVDFLEGDPDRPIITGRVYNGAQMPPYALPEERTKSTIKTHSTEQSEPKRFHEIRFEDKNKSEQLFIRAQRRMDTRVLGPHYHTTGGSLHEYVGYENEEGEKKGRYFRTVNEGIDLHDKGDQYVWIEDKVQTRIEKDVLDAFMANYALMVKDKIEVNAKEMVIEMKEKLALKVGGNFIVIDAQGVTIVGQKVKINSGGSAPSVGDQEGLKPLDAIPADTGKPGKKGGPWKPRTREGYTIEAQHAPPPPPPPPPPGGGTPETKVPPDVKCAVLAISATCGHTTPNPRTVTQGMTLEVVPNRDWGWDRIDLAATMQMPCGEHPEWTISGRSSKRGLKTDFNATGPILNKFAWIPTATPNKYKVFCRGCNGPSQWLEVHAYPLVEVDVPTIDLNKLLEVLRLFTKLLEWVADVVITERLKVTYLKGKVQAQAKWKEWTDWRAYYAYSIVAALDPLVGIEGEVPIGTKFLTKKLKLVPWLGKYVQKVIDWVIKAGIRFKVSLGISVECKWERTSPDQPKFVANQGKGVHVTGGLGIGLEGNVIGDKVVSVEIIAGEAKFFGDAQPYIDDGGFGVRKLEVKCEGITSSLKVKLLDGVLEKETPQITWFRGGTIVSIDEVSFYPPGYKNAKFFFREEERS